MTSNQKTSATIILANPTDSGLGLLVTTANGTSGMIKIHNKKYDENKGEHGGFVDDAATYEKALKLIQDLGATSFETAPVELLNKEIPTVYELKGEVRLNPIVEFQRFDKVTPADAKKFNREIGEEYVFLPVSEYKGNRFNVGFLSKTKDGQEKVFRVSQIKIEPVDEDQSAESVSLKYTTKDIDTLRQQIKDEKLPEQMIPAVKESIANMADTSRKRQLEELSKTLNVDFENDVLTGKVLLKARISVQEIKSSGSVTYWLQAVVDEGEDFFVENPDYVEED